MKVVRERLRLCQSVEWDWGKGTADECFYPYEGL